MLVVAVALSSLFLYALGTRPGPRLEDAVSADVVARVESRGRDTIAVTSDVDDPYDLDVVRFEVVEQEPLLVDAPVLPPRLDDTVEVTVLERASWWEDGVGDGELVVFLAHVPERAGPAWRLLFAVDANSARITGEFDDDWSRETYAALAREAGASAPRARIETLVAWIRGSAERRPGAWTVAELSTFPMGQAVAGDVTVDRDEPFDVAAWRALPADQRLLPVGPSDPALDALQPALGLRSVAVAVRPNEAFDVPVTEVAIEFDDIGLLGWIPLRDGEPTGLVGAAPADDGEVRVRVLGRTAAGDVQVLQQLGDDVGADESMPLRSLVEGRAQPGPWALVIGLEATSDLGDGIALRQTSIDELGLLLERAGR